MSAVEPIIMVTTLFHPAVLLPLIAGLVAGCGINSPAPATEVDGVKTAAMEAGFGDGRVWQVGPEREFKTPSAVADRVGDGDVVLIDAAAYPCDAGVVWWADRLTLKGVGGRARLEAEDCAIPGGRGIWNPRGTDLLIDNIEFSGASVSDANGAGIRFEGGGRVIIKNSFFHHNENGILYTPAPGSWDSTDLLIEHSEFAHNGDGSGQTHNLYINAARSLTFRYNYSHDSRIGHLFKSRARNNHILYNRLSTMNGDGSYEIDIPHGGDAWIIGNIIQQGANSENKGIIAYGAEASLNPGDEFADGHLYVIANTIINDRADGADLINPFDYQAAEMRVLNNLLVDIPEGELEFLDDQGAKLAGNLLTRNPAFRDRQHYNYALVEGAPAIDGGVVLEPDHLGQALAPEQSYRHPRDVQPRRQTGDGPDIGALEYDEQAPDSPLVTLHLAADAIEYGADAVLDWTATAAESCLALGDWGGEMTPEGTAEIGPLNQGARFTLACEGPGGSAEASITVEVADHPLAAGYPDYRFVELEGTESLPFCRDDFPFRGVQGCDGRDVSAAYVPEQNAYYLFGGGHRAYYGNEVLRLDLTERELALAAGPTDPRETTNFSADNDGDFDIIGDCRGVWDLKDGGVAPAPATVYSSWIYAPPAKKIFKNGGLVACGSPVFDADSWWFDPFGEGWQLIDREGPIPPHGSHSVYDPDSGQIMIIARGAIYRFDPASEDLVELGEYYDVPWSTTPVLDPENDVILLIGDGDYQQSKFTVIDLLGVDATSRSLPDQGAWTAKGDLSLLDMTSPGLAYDEDNKVVVGWGGGDTLYFPRIDRDAREVEFITKKIEDAPRYKWAKRNSFLYASKEKAFVAYTGAARNFYLLKAPD